MNNEQTVTTEQDQDQVDIEQEQLFDMDDEYCDEDDYPEPSYFNRLRGLNTIDDLPQDIIEQKIWTVNHKMDRKDYLRDIVDLELSGEDNCYLRCLEQDGDTFVMLVVDPERKIKSIDCGMPVVWQCELEAERKRRDEERDRRERERHEQQQRELQERLDRERQEQAELDKLFNFDEDVDGDDWVVDPGIDSTKPVVGISSEQQILDRVQELDRRTITNAFFVGKNKTTFSPYNMRQYLKDVVGLDFMLLEGQDGIKAIRYNNNNCYILDTNRTIGKVIAKIMGDQLQTGHIKSTLTLIESVDTYGKVGSSEFACLHKEWINCSNGWLHIRSGKFFTHELFSKKYPDVKSVIQFPVDYDPDADCQLFDEFLRDKLPTENEVNYLYEILGYCLYQGLPLKKLFVFKGDSDTGKSTVLKVFTAVLGKRNISNKSLSEIDGKNVFGRSALYGRQVNISHEVTSLALSANGPLKLCCEDSPQDIQDKFISSFSTTLFTTLIASTNHRITSKIKDDGFENRVVIVPFDKSHKGKADPKVEHDLLQKDVIEGVFVKSFRSLRNLLKRGKFIKTPAMEQAKIKNFMSINPVLQWADEHLIKDGTVERNDKTVPARLSLKQIRQVMERNWDQKELGKLPSPQVFNKLIGEWAGQVPTQINDYTTGSKSLLIPGVVFDLDNESVKELKYTVPDHNDVKW